MAYFEEIKNLYKDGAESKLEMISNNRLIIEGYKSALSFTNDYLEVRVGRRKKVIVIGENLSIDELYDGFLKVDGKILEIKFDWEGK